MNNRFRFLIIPIILFALAFAQSVVVAQTFSINPNHNEQSGKPGDFFAANITVKNLTNQDVTVKVKKASSTLPSDWGGSMCTTSNCFGFDASNVEDVLKANTTGQFTIDVSTSETPGSGEVVINIQSKANASESYNFTMKVTTNATATDEANAARPLALSQNYPNPFSVSKNQNTTITFTTPTNTHVALRVFTLLGQEVRTLYSAARMGGTAVVSWDGRNNAGALVPAGMYIYKIETGSNTISRRMLVTR